MEKKIRITYLDVAKGIGILFVLILHSCGLSVLNKFICAFFMPLFFFISGYLCDGIEKKKIRELMKRRAYKLLKPYFTYSLILACIFFTKYLFIDHNIKQVAINILGIFYSRDYIKNSTLPIMRICNNALWFLTAMFMSYLIFYGIVLMEERKILNRNWMMILLLIITMLLNNLPILLPWSIDSAFLCAFFMLSGYYAKNIELFEKNHTILQLMLIGISLGVFIIICIYNGSPNLAVREYGDRGNISVVLYASTGIIGSVLCIYLSKMLMNLGAYKILEYIGKNTMPLLAYHFLVFSIYDKIVTKFFDTYTHVTFFNIMKILMTVIIIIGWEQIILICKKIMRLHILEKINIK